MSKHILVAIIFTLSLMLFSLSAQAVKLQILHTNDLHGFLESTIIDKKLGGYYNIKRVFDKQTKLAKANNIETLKFDGGDFSEGSIFYLSQKGRRNFELMNLLGYDAAVLGNHDWLMGTEELNNILKDVPPKYSLLAANLRPNSLIFPALSETVKKYEIFEIGEIRIAVIGLITKEKFYEWRFDKCKILSPIKTAKKLAKRLKKNENVDFVFVLSHIGVLNDKKVIENNSDIDLIIGGHSHTELHRPWYVKDKNGKLRPIVQAGEHGKYVGQLILNLEKNIPLSIEKYKLLPVKHQETQELSSLVNVTDSSNNSGSVVKEYIKETRQILEAEYSKQWLSEVIGYSEIPLISSFSQITVWTAFITDSLRECVNADFSAHSPGFGGTNLPSGAITREDLFQAHPRIFDFKNKFGWHLYEVNIKGFWLKTIIKLILSKQMPVAFSGVTFDLVNKDEENISVQYGDVINTNIDNEEKFITQFLGINTNFKVKNIKIKGDPIKWNKSYKMALPAGIVLGGVGITKLVKLILKNIARKEVSVWECLNQKVQREKTITAKYSQRPGVDKSTHMKFVIPSLMPEKKIYDKRQLQSAIGPK